MGGDRRQDIRADVPLRVQFNEVIALRGRRDESLATIEPGRIAATSQRVEELAAERFPKPGRRHVADQIRTNL
jgi:hypothetical protein